MKTSGFFRSCVCGLHTRVSYPSSEKVGAKTGKCPLQIPWICEKSERIKEGGDLLPGGRA